MITKHKRAQAKSQANGELRSEELEYVDKLIVSLPPIVTRGEQWFICENGIWEKRDFSYFEPEALGIIHPSRRTHRLAVAILRHIQGKLQLKSSLLHGAYKFDGADILVSVANGVVRIHDGELSLENCSRDHYFTQSLAVHYDPQARCPAFDKALLEHLPDPKDRALFDCFTASGFVPDCRWEIALICFGESGTGKSTLFEGIEAMFGEGPSQSLSLSSLCDAESYNGPDLEFAMINLGTECNALELAGDRFKQLVSGERVSVRGIYQAPSYIKPTCKYAFLTNHLPRFKDGTAAELRRLRFLKFACVPPVKDASLKALVRQEGSGIFNRFIGNVSELLLLHEIPESGAGSEETRERFKIVNDPIGAFVQTECELSSDYTEDKSDFQTRFASFLEFHGFSDKLIPSLFSRLYERFPVHSYRPRISGARTQILKGIKLKPSYESEVI